MPAFVRIEISDKLKCQGGATKLGVLYPTDLASAKDILAIDDQESLTFAFSRVDRSSGAVRPIVATLVARTIATVIWDDGSYDERRVSLIEDGQAVGGLITVTCNPLILDLAEGADSSTGKGFVSTTSGCLRVYNYGVVGLTATQFWDTYVIPACPTWVSRGTIDPTATIPQLTWDRLTPQALALQVRDTLRKMNVTCELRLRRNGTTDYKLDLVTQVGSSATVPLFHPRSTLQSLKRRIDSTQQATRLFVTGQSDPSGVAGIPGRARWIVTNVDGANKKLTLADPNGGAGPIAMTNQWANAYVVRVSTGRSFQIQASDAAAQTVTLLALSTIAVGELFEIRLTEPLTNARVIATPSPRWSVTSIGASAEYIAMSGNPITTDNTYLDWYARVWTASVGGSIRKDVRITGSTAAADRAACTPGDCTGVINTDYVEFIQLDGAGEVPSYLEHATAILANPAGYGMKAGDLAVGTAVGVTQLGTNPWMRTWSNPANPPDGWTVLGAAGTRNANALYTRYGGYSFYTDWYGGGSTTVLQTPRFDPVLAVSNTRLSARCQVFFATFTGTHYFHLEVYALAQDGTVTGAPLGNCNVIPTNFVGTPAVGSITGAVGAWVTMEITGIDISLDKIPYGIRAQVRDELAAVGQCLAYVDTIETYQFVANPADIYEFGDATVLHQAGNRQLLMNGTPPVAYTLTIVDAERADPTGAARNALTIGGSVRSFDADIGIDTTVRLLRLERDLLRPKASTVGLASLPTLLTQLVQG